MTVRAPNECVCKYAHCNASVVHFFVILITVLVLVLQRITRWFSEISGISTTRLIVGDISAMVEKELGEGNFGFDSPELNEPQHEGERDCSPQLSPTGASGAPAGDKPGQQFLSPPCRGSIYFRLMCK